MKLENQRELAIISEIDGKVKIKETKKKKEVIVTSKDDSRTYTIPFGSKMRVKDGDTVEAGQPLNRRIYKSIRNISNKRTRRCV